MRLEFLTFGQALDKKMDPTELYLRHRDPFAAAEKLPSFTEWLITHEYEGVPATHSSAREQEQKVSVTLPDLQEELQTLTEHAEQFDAATLKRCRDSANPFHQLNTSIFKHRAAIVLANIDAVYSLTYEFGDLDVSTASDQVERRYATHSFKTEQTYEVNRIAPATVELRQPRPFWFADLGGAPGGMAEYLLWRREASSGFGFAPRSSEAWDTTRLPTGRFSFNYGSDGDGDLFSEDAIRSFSSFVRKRAGTGLDLVVASSASEQDLPEREQTKLALAQTATALLCLNPRGAFVLQLADVTQLLTIQLIQLLAESFETISLFKPVSVHPASNQRYLICRTFRGEAGAAVALLISAINLYDTGRVTSLFKEEELDKGLLAFLRRNNELLLNAQLDTLERMIVCVDPKIEGADELPEAPVYHLARSNRLWYLPDADDKTAHVLSEQSRRDRGGYASRGGDRGGYASRGGDRGGYASRGRGGRGGTQPNRAQDVYTKAATRSPLPTVTSSPAVSSASSSSSSASAPSSKIVANAASRIRTAKPLTTA